MDADVHEPPPDGIEGWVIGLMEALGEPGAAIAVVVARRWVPAVTLSLSVVLLALSVALVTGVVSGFLPAWRASRVDPLTAIRAD